MVSLTDKGHMAASDLPIMQDDRSIGTVSRWRWCVADTLEQAEHAASLVEVEYEAGPAVLSFDAARRDARVPPT